MTIGFCVVRNEGVHEPFVGRQGVLSARRSLSIEDGSAIGESR